MLRGYLCPRMITQQLQEQVWWQSIKDHDDERAFNRLYMRNWQVLFAIAWNRVKDEAVAKDIVQEVFVSFWERRKQVDVRTTVAQYLTGALKYRLIDFFQSERIRQRVFDQALAQMDRILQHPDNDLSYQEVEAIFEDELKRMPENMRKSFLLRLDNLSTPDIAKQLNLAEQTVSNLLSEATKRLKNNLPNRFEKHSVPLLIPFLLQAVHDLLINK